MIDSALIVIATMVVFAAVTFVLWLFVLQALDTYQKHREEAHREVVRDMYRQVTDAGYYRAKYEQACQRVQELEGSKEAGQ